LSKELLASQEGLFCTESVILNIIKKHVNDL